MYYDRDFNNADANNFKRPGASLAFRFICINSEISKTKNSKIKKGRLI